MVQDSILSLLDAAANVNGAANPVGPISIVDPARNLVAKCDQEAQTDRVVAIACHPRFVPRRLAPPLHILSD